MTRSQAIGIHVLERTMVVETDLEEGQDDESSIPVHKYESKRSYMIVPKHLIATYYYDDVQQIFGIPQLTFLELE